MGKRWKGKKSYSNGKKLTFNIFLLLYLKKIRIREEKSLVYISLNFSSGSHSLDFPLYLLASGVFRILFFSHHLFLFFVILCMCPFFLLT